MKQNTIPNICNSILSLPSWERGLKLEEDPTMYSIEESLPSWERGLKYDGELDGADEISVAPLVGAWTEII